MQTVSFETAKILKEAGFPQDDGYELWEDGLYYAEPSDEPNEIFLKRGGEIDSEYNVIAYAPTATELLPIGWVLLRCNYYWISISASNLVNSVGINYVEPYFEDENSHEAAAKAWLFVNKK